MHVPATYTPHVPQRAEGGWGESVLRMDFPSPGGTTVGGPEPRKNSPDLLTASSSYLVPPTPLAHGWQAHCCSCCSDFESCQHDPGEGSEDSLRPRLEQLHWTPRQSALGNCPLAFLFPTQEAGAQGDEDKKGWTDRKTPCHEPCLISEGQLELG